MLGDLPVFRQIRQCSAICLFVDPLILGHKQKSNKNPDFWQRSAIYLFFDKSDSARRFTCFSVSLTSSYKRTTNKKTRILTVLGDLPVFRQIRQCWAIRLFSIPWFSVTNKNQAKKPEFRQCSAIYLFCDKSDSARRFTYFSVSPISSYNRTKDGKPRISTVLGDLPVFR